MSDHLKTRHSEGGISLKKRYDSGMLKDGCVKIPGKRNLPKDTQWGAH